MASPTREQVYSALFTLLSTTPAITALVTSFSRVFSIIDQVEPADMPRLMVWEQPEKSEFAGPAMSRKRVWNAAIVVYFQNTDKTVAGATIINPIIDAIEAAMRWDNPSAGKLTLGGLVEYCRIEGQTIKETGDTDAELRGGAVIPVRILVP